jgi:hypothetical protein
MDVGIVEAVLANIAAQMAGIVQALVPLGTALAGSRWMRATPSGPSCRSKG